MSLLPEKSAATGYTAPTTASGALPTASDNTPQVASSQAHSDEPAPDYDSLYNGSNNGRIPEEPQRHTDNPSIAPTASNATSATSASQEKAPKKSMSSRLASHTPSFMPAPLERECEKAAAILKAFCKDGVYSASPEDPANPASSSKKSKAIVSIPPRVIQNAVGLAIFTTLRAGFHLSGAMGSGVVIARLPDGSWGPPSGISVLSVGGGFQFGVDVYDCVCVINTREALAAFMDKTRVSLGSDVAVAAGPYGVGGAIDVGASYADRGNGAKDKKAGAEGVPTADGQRPAAKSSQSSASGASLLRPVFSYVKSRGFYAGIQIDGTVIVERRDANTKFYGSPVAGSQILAGNVPSTGSWQAGVKTLQDTLMGAQAGALQSSENISGIPAATSSTSAQGPTSAAAMDTNASASATPSRDFKYSDIVGDQPAGPNGADVPPPAYVDDGAVRPGVGDHKSQA